MPLRKSGEDYLEAILVLQKKRGVVRSVEVKLDLRFFLSDKLIILLAEHIACIGIGAAMLGIVFCADF